MKRRDFINALACAFTAAAAGDPDHPAHLTYAGELPFFVRIPSCAGEWVRMPGDFTIYGAGFRLDERASIDQLHQLMFADNAGAGSQYRLAIANGPHPNGRGVEVAIESPPYPPSTYDDVPLIDRPFEPLAPGESVLLTGQLCEAPVLNLLSGSMNFPAGQLTSPAGRLFQFPAAGIFARQGTAVLFEVSPLTNLVTLELNGTMRYYKTHHEENEKR